MSPLRSSPCIVLCHIHGYPTYLLDGLERCAALDRKRFRQPQPPRERCVMLRQIWNLYRHWEYGGRNGAGFTVSGTDNRPQRPWRLIANELTQTVEIGRVLELTRELAEALDRQKPIDYHCNAAPRPAPPSPISSQRKKSA